MNADPAQAILITGGSRGIGRAAALFAAARGWSVAINFLSDEGAAAQTAMEVEEAGARAILIRGDVSIESDVVAMFDSAETSFGRLDGVVNNAGIVAPPLRLSEMSAERLQRMFTVNVYGAYLCAREAARRLSSHRARVLSTPISTPAAWQPDRAERLVKTTPRRPIRPSARSGRGHNLVD